MPTKHKSDTQGTGIHLVDSSASARHDDNRLKLGSYDADIVSSKTGNCCYYVIQRAGSAEIIEMERFDTAEDARATARHALERWNHQDFLRRVAS